MTNSIIGSLLVILSVNTTTNYVTKEVGISCQQAGCTNQETRYFHCHFTNSVLPACHVETITVGVRVPTTNDAVTVVGYDSYPGTYQLMHFADLPMFDIITQTPRGWKDGVQGFYESYTTTIIKRRKE